MILETLLNLSAALRKSALARQHPVCVATPRLGFPLGHNLGRQRRGALCHPAVCHPARERGTSLALPGGCTLLVDPTAIVTTFAGLTDAEGMLDQALALPLVHTLRGFDVSGQAAALAPATPLGLGLSQGLRLTSLGCNDDLCGSQSQVTVATVAGADYRVRVGGNGVERGTFSLVITTANCGGGSFQTLRHGCGAATSTTPATPRSARSRPSR